MARKPPPMTDAELAAARARFLGVQRTGVGVDIAVHIDLAQLAGWPPDQLHALMLGIGQVVAAIPKESDDDR